MSKRKTLRRLSSAALLSLAMYSQTMTPGWTKEVRAFETKTQTKIVRSIDVKKKLGEVNIGRGTVKSISGSTLVVTDNKGKNDVNVIVDDKTKLVSKSLMKVGLTDIAVGHEVSVMGKVENGDTSSIRATNLRDLSLMIRIGQFNGVVESVGATSLVMKMNKMNSITVTIGTAVISNRAGKVISLADVVVGNRIKVKGTYNGADKTLSSVATIRDLSLPVK